VDPSVYVGLDFSNWFIQPKDGPDAAESLQAAIRYCAEHPRWRLSLQTHKLIGIR
jgi:organic radical activating enzyme